MGSCVGQFSNAQQFILVGSTDFQLVYVVKSNGMGFVVSKGKHFKSRVKQITCVDSLPNKNQVFVCDQEGSAHMFTTLDKEEFNIMKSVNVNSNVYLVYVFDRKCRSRVVRYCGRRTTISYVVAT